MATLSNFGIPGVGSGILHPRLKHKFRITFLNIAALVSGTNSRDLSWPVTVEADITGLAATVIKNQLETQQRIIGADLDGRWLNTAATGSDYKFGAKIDQLDGDEGVVQTWILEGVQIMNADYGDRDYSTSEAATITMSLRYDHARHIESGQGYGTALGGNVAA